MKKITIILATVIASFATVSCITDFGDDRPRATLPGKVIFDYTESDISYNIMLADIALKLNAYIEAPADKKTSIEDRFFPTIKLRQNGNEWDFINSSFSLVTDGKSLNAPGAKWVIIRHASDIHNYAFSIEIECTAEKEWKITNKSSVSPEDLNVSSANLVMKAKESNDYSALYSYSVSGSGNFTYLYNQHSSYKPIKVNYTISRALDLLMKDRQSSSNDVQCRFFAAKGTVDMAVTGVYDEKIRDLINSDLSSSIGENISNKITYRGVSEFWTYSL